MLDKMKVQMVILDEMLRCLCSVYKSIHLFKSNQIEEKRI